MRPSRSGVPTLIHFAGFSGHENIEKEPLSKGGRREIKGMREKVTSPASDDGLQAVAHRFKIMKMKKLQLEVYPIQQPTAPYRSARALQFESADRSGRGGLSGTIREGPYGDGVVIFSESGRNSSCHFER
jgi:hypothetical protein